MTIPATNLWLALALLAGCSTQAARPVDSRAALLVAPNLISSRSASQVVHASYGAQSITLQCAIEVADNQLTLIALTTLGQRVYTVHYDGKQVLTDRAAFVPAGIDAQQLLTDVQLALWPLAALQPGWQRLGYELSEPLPGLRRLRQNDKIVSEVHYASAEAWNGRLWLVNLRYGYSLTVDTTLAQ